MRVSLRLSREIASASQAIFSLVISVSLSSQMARSSRALSSLIPDSPTGFGFATSVHEEAARVFKNTKSEHIKNHKIEGTRGEGLGLVLIEMASKFIDGS